MVMEHEVIVGVVGEDDVAEDWTIRWWSGVRRKEGCCISDQWKPSTAHSPRIPDAGGGWVVVHKYLLGVSHQINWK